MTSPATPTELATRREWIGLAVLALPCMLLTMDLTVLFLAVPALSADLQPSSTQLLWITDIYGFLIAGSLVTMGTLGDRIGRRRLLLAGAVVFGATSVMAAFAPSAELLILSRALLGVAGATLMPSTLSLIRTMFADPGQRTTAIGVWAGSLSAGAALGPLAGGILLEHFWWGSVFLLNVPVMAVLLVVGRRLLPEYRDPAPGRFDLPSAALSIVAMLALVYAVKHTVTDRFDQQALAALTAGLAAGVLFIRRQRRLDDPLLDLDLFRRPAFSAALATNTLGIFALLGLELFVAQYLQLVLGMGPLEAGLWTLPSGAAFLVGSALTPVLARRLPPVTVIVSGILLAVAGVLAFTQVQGNSGLTAVVAGTVLMALGICPAMTLGTDLIVSSAPAERAGAASAISETGTELGGALGAAVLGSVGAAVYRGRMDGIEGPAGDTLAGASGSLLAPATEAFTAALHVVAFAGAGVLAFTAAIVFAFLGERRAWRILPIRRRRPGAQCVGQATRGGPT